MKDRGLGKNLETYAIVSLMGGIFLLDLFTQLGVAVGMLYVVPIFMTTRFRNDRHIIHIGLVAITLIFIVAFFKPVTFSGAYELVVPNRIMMMISISVASALSVMTVRRAKQLEKIGQDLSHQVNERTRELAGTVERLQDEIDEKQMAESSVRELEQRSRIVFQAVRDAMGVSKDGRHIFVNPAYVDLFGYDSEDELMEKTIVDLIAPSQRERVGHYIKRRWTKVRAPTFYETIGYRRDGMEFDMEVKVSEIDWYGEHASLVIMRDISERKAAEAALMESKLELEVKVKERTLQLAKEKDMLTTTLRSIGDAVIATDIKENVTIMNRVAEELTGWTLEEAVGRDLREVFVIINERTRKPVENPARVVIESGGIVGLANHTLLISRSGVEIPIGDSGAPIRNEEGETAGVVLVFRDMTSEMKSIAEMEKSQRLESLGILAGGIAHDFNNVLTAIEGNISIARMKIKQNPEVTERLEEAEKAFSRARHLTRQLLTFAKGGEPVKSVVSAGPLVRDTTRFALSGSNVKPRFNVMEDLWNIEADEGQIGQVLQNLIINAKESMPQGGELFVSAENVMYKMNDGNVPSKAVAIRIRDHGIGIPPNYMKKIFDPYFTTKQNGRGLGLTIVFSIIEKHGGHVEVDSYVGEGTTFTIYLPALIGQIAVRPQMPSASRENHGTVLWMDDEKEVLEVVREFLTINGYHSLTAEDGAEAIRTFQEARDSGKDIVAVILDLTVPGGMGGKDTIQALRKIDPKVRAIVCSGYYSDPVMANFGMYGFDAVLQKPFSIEELNQVLAQTLNGSGDGRNN